MRRLVIDVQHGLSNRLRAYACAQVIARAGNRQLTIVWQPDAHCQCVFQDLFENQLDVLDSLSSVNLDGFKIYNCMDVEGPNDLHTYIDEHIDSDIYIRSGQWLSNSRVTWPAVVSVLKELRPLKKLEDIVARHQVDDKVGLHIRMQKGVRFEHLPWESVDNWSVGGHEEILRWTEKTTLPVFTRKVDEILAGRPDEKFFLCSDLEMVYEAMSERYGEAIMFVKRNCFDRSGEQASFALVDLLLLSKTKYIIGSGYSTFSILAAMYGGKDLSVTGIDF